MKFHVAAMAALVAGSMALTACGNAAQVKTLSDSLEACTKSKADSDSKVATLTQQLADANKQIADMKAAATTATPAPTPGKTTTKPTPKPKK